ncbi:MAG: sugar ABC transporter substrate-binding protein [Planctomycetota bacterium]|nr:sugar ABC transporter substrate-binding protein [Planctomycetota bacterium]
MQTQLSLRIVVVLAALGLFVGCDTKSSTPQGKSSGKPQVALVMKSLANEFFKTMEDGAKAHQKAHAAEYDLIANGIPDEQDVAKQSDLVEQMIAKKVDAIVIAPTDSKAMVPVCKKALDAGVVVINIDNKLDEAALKEKGITVPFVGPDNRMGARLAGECLAKKLQKGDQVAIIEGLRGAFNAEQRRLGFEDAMKAAGATIATSQSARWETEPAVAIVGPILLAQPQLKAILCANDSMALGAISALRGANKLGQIQVVGFDNIKAVQQLIKEGKMLCTIDQHADQIAAYGIEYAIQILQRKATPADKQTPVNLITAETLK